MADHLDVLCGGKRLKLMVDSKTKEQLMEGHTSLGTYIQQLQNSKLNKEDWPTDEECENAAIIVDENETVEPETVIVVPDDISLADDSTDASIEEAEELAIYIWPVKAAKLLIGEYKAHKAVVDGGRMKKKTLWKIISEKLKTNGYTVSPLQCENKWKALMRRYRQHNSKKGNHSTHCPFEEELRDVLEMPEEINLEDDKADNIQSLNNESEESINCNWPAAAARVLIAEYKTFKTKLDNRQMKKTTFWKAISAKLKTSGYNLSPLQCENKWKAVTRRYKCIMQYNAQAENKPRHCPFEEELAEVFQIPDNTSCADDNTDTGQNNEAEESTSYMWPMTATKVLIGEYKACKTEVDSGRMKKKTLWNDISRKLKTKGYIASPMQCENKWKALMRRYKQVFHHNSKTGNNPMHCLFEKELGEVLHDDAMYNATSVCSTLTGVSGSSTSQNVLYNIPVGFALQVLPSQLPSCQSPSIAPSSQTSSPPQLIGARVKKRKRNAPEPEPEWLAAYKEHQERLNRERIEAMERAVSQFSQTMCSIFEKYMGNPKED